jgi:hypothetical protein
MKTSIIQLTRAALLTAKVYGRDGREVLTRSGDPESIAKAVEKLLAAE